MTKRALSASIFSLIAVLDLFIGSALYNAFMNLLSNSRTRPVVEWGLAQKILTPCNLFRISICDIMTAV